MDETSSTTLASTSTTPESIVEAVIIKAFIFIGSACVLVAIAITISVKCCKDERSSQRRRSSYPTVEPIVVVDTQKEVKQLPIRARSASEDTLGKNEAILEQVKTFKLGEKVESAESSSHESKTKTLSRSKSRTPSQGISISSTATSPSRTTSSESAKKVTTNSSHDHSSQSRPEIPKEGLGEAQTKTHPEGPTGVATEIAPEAPLESPGKAPLKAATEITTEVSSSKAPGKVTAKVFSKSSMKAPARAFSKTLGKISSSKKALARGKK